jgi:hypothetical protein
VTELGLELDTSEEREASFDYSDLLDEPAPNEQQQNATAEANGD